jgi:type IV fimbrial biogenesis protein FimT
MPLNNQKISYGIKGFTLIELMVTIAIAGIVLTIGVPSFSQVMKNSRLTSSANALIVSLNFARSEAVKRKVKVFVGRKGSISQNWDGGWDVFIDLNANEVFNDGTDTLLKTFSAISDGYTLRTGANYDDWIAFSPSGFTDGSGSSNKDSFGLCAASGDTENSRKISVNKVGRARVSIGDVTSCP